MQSQGWVGMHYSMKHGGLWMNTNNGGPGQTLSTYLPKAENLEKKVADSLDPAVAENPQKGNDKGQGKGKGKPNRRQGLSVIEKRLCASTWRCQGKQHNGAHFPLAAFTANVGRRSEARYVARNERGWT